MNKNQHIIDNLDNYLSLTNPEYAFLINGEWGIGKTYFIEKYIENKKDKYQLIKISLFGLKSINEINSNIYQNLHPILGSKHARLASHMIKGALSMGIRLDLNFDENPETLLNLKASSLSSFFDNDIDNKETCIVFDDLERSSIPIKELLGFINQLVETSQVKTILIANEDNILACTEKEQVYKSFKEKVIGKTFRIEHNINDVLNAFLLKNTLHNHKDIILDIYNKSDIKNLRKLKQIIDDFDYLAKNIDKKYIEHGNFYSNLVRCFFALSIEIKKGSLSQEQLSSGLPFDFTKKNGTIYEKYFNNHDHITMFDGNVWVNILFDGNIKNINEKISELIFFTVTKKEENPNWLKLWSHRRVDNETFNNLIMEFENDLISNTECELGVYLHKLSLAVYFSKNNLCTLSILDIEKIVKKYIDKNKASNLWKNIIKIDDNQHKGYGYYHGYDDDFKRLKYLIQTENHKTYNDEQKNIIQKDLSTIMSNINSSTYNDSSMILLQKYELTPIFNHLDTTAFIEAIKSADNNSISNLEDIIYARYAENTYIHNKEKYLYFKSELKFWKEVTDRKDYILSNQVGLNKHLLTSLINKITTLVDLLSQQ